MSKKKNLKRLSQEEIVRILEKEQKSKLQTLEQWLDYIIDQAEHGYGALTIPFFLPNELETVKKLKEEMKPISHRLYVTEPIMEAQMEQIIGYNKIWRDRMLSLEKFYPNKILLQNSLNDILVL